MFPLVLYLVLGSLAGLFLYMFLAVLAAPFLTKIRNPLYVLGLCLVVGIIIVSLLFELFFF